MDIKISIITVVYNSVAVLQDTIVSVLNQSYNNVEYIIIDGNSTDGTLDVINKYREKISIFVSEPDNGIYDAMNKGIKLSTGSWLLFMNAGDTFYDNKVLENFASGNCEKYDIVYGNALRQFKNTSNLWVPSSLSTMWRKMSFCHQSTFVKVSYHQARLFDENYKLSADYDFFYESYYLLGAKFKHINLLVCRFSMEGKSGIDYIASAKENLMMAHKFKILKSIVYMNLSVLYRSSIRRLINSAFYK